MSAVVVVLPCVPVTTTEWRLRRKSEPSAAGKLIWGRRRARTAVASGFTRRMTFPMTTRSGFARSRFAGSYGVNTGIDQARSMSLMGG